MSLSYDGSTQFVLLVKQPHFSFAQDEQKALSIFPKSATFKNKMSVVANIRTATLLNY
jgi:hypothetical protein